MSQIENRFATVEAELKSAKIELKDQQLLLAQLAVAHNVTTGNVSLCNKAMKLCGSYKLLITSLVPHEYSEKAKIFGKKIGDHSPAAMMISDQPEDLAFGKAWLKDNKPKKAAAPKATQEQKDSLGKLEGDVKKLVDLLVSEGVAITKILAAVEKL